MKKAATSKLPHSLMNIKSVKCFTTAYEFVRHLVFSSTFESGSFCVLLVFECFFYFNYKQWLGIVLCVKFTTTKNEMQKYLFMCKYRLCLEFIGVEIIYFDYVFNVNLLFLDIFITRSK